MSEMVSMLSAVGFAVPEPASWIMVIGGLTLIGTIARRSETVVSFV